MNEQEVKEIVERIVMLEDKSSAYSSNDDFYAAGYCTEKADTLEKELERAGFVLGEEGEDIIVYRANLLLTAQSTYLIFDTANWCWRQPESEVV
jgi:hypothetical protein